MDMLDYILSKVAPYECLGCGDEGLLVCQPCSLLLKSVPERCYRCQKYSPDSLTCARCRKVSRLHRVQVATTYQGVTKTLIWKLKFDGAKSAAKEIAQLLPDLTEEVMIIPIPTASGRVRSRGYDQAVLIAKALSKKSSRPLDKNLVRSGQAHQVGASRQQRFKQLKGAFRVRSLSSVQNRHIILVDDVLTTGATLEAAASVLRKSGARRIDAIVFAQA